jgi:hypothetical protein
LHAKALYSITGNRDQTLLRSKNHSLKGLFEKLPDSKKDWLNVLYAEFNEQASVISLADDLEKFDNTFIDWRYLFEGNAVSVPTSLLDELITFFEFACSKPSTDRFKFPT